MNDKSARKLLSDIENLSDNVKRENITTCHELISELNNLIEFWNYYLGIKQRGIYYDGSYRECIMGYRCYWYRHVIRSSCIVV